MTQPAIVEEKKTRSELKNNKGKVVGLDRSEQFRAAFQGELIQPGDSGYEMARKIWNASIDKHPGIIARVDPGESQRHIEWARGLSDSMRPFSSGGYLLNFLGEEGEETIKAAFGPNYDRLMAVKKKYDPKNFFCLNQNIKPRV
jgi:Berberine and berberine like